MADDEYRRLTVVGCEAPGCASDVRTAGLCVRHYQRKRKHGATDDRTFTCGQCGQEFTSPRTKKYCSQRCCWVAQGRKAGVRPRAQYDASVKNPAAEFTCEHCGASAKRKLGGNSTRNRWCSMACRSAASQRAKAEAAAFSQLRRERKAAVRRLIKALKLRALDLQRASCAGCGCEIDRRKRVCATCRNAATREAERNYRAGPAGKRTRRIHKSKEKAVRRQRLAKGADSIDPIAVFERDKWRCQICGVRTPKGLRGSCEARAPELDHVIALALGGTHTWGNVQCACRGCNGAKGARAVGQLGLGFS